MKGVVYARTAKAANDKLQEIANSYIRCNISILSRKPNNRTGDIINFTNGDTWEACSVNTRTPPSGKRYNVAYAESAIALKTFNEIIVPSLTLPPYQAWHRF